MSSPEQEDVVTRLRDMSLDHEQVCQDAAAEIKQLRQSIEELQARVFPVEPEPDPNTRKRKKFPPCKIGAPAKERLMAMIEVDQATGCWVWCGSGTYRYGKLKDDNGKDVYAHRFSYEVHTGYKFKEGEQALHICDNTWCVNPSHIRHGTAKDNMEDKTRKGRHSGSKLTLEQAMEIRRRYNAGETGASLGEKFGISESTVHHIGCGRKWSYADESGEQKPAKRKRSRWSKLTPEDVRDIRKRRARGETQVSIAARYKIDPTTVSAIVHRLRWAGVK